MSGLDPRSGLEFIHVDSSSGGWGACEDIDGESCLIAIQDGDSKNVPTELVERRYPLRIAQFCLREDSSGAGKYRGGLGHIRDFEILTGPVKLLTSVERHGYRPWGIAGGSDGLSNNAILNPGTRQERQVRKVTNFALKTGDILSMRSGGGGGYDRACKRDPLRVLEDVIDGYVSIQNARAEYKCVIQKKRNSYVIDSVATKALRFHRKKSPRTKRGMRSRITD
jgi:N-methylhydantoinase B